jgi:hypothetical protein
LHRDRRAGGASEDVDVNVKVNVAANMDGLRPVEVAAPAARMR